LAWRPASGQQVRSFFCAAGELLDGKPEEIDPYLIYDLDRGDGRIETLAPAEFRKLLPGE